MIACVWIRVCGYLCVCVGKGECVWVLVICYKYVNNNSYNAM